MKRSRMKSRSQPIDRRRKARKRIETLRIYGDEDRQTWYRAHGCVGCARVPVELHHVTNGGMGRKAGADSIVPLCATCHQQIHDWGVLSFEQEKSQMLCGMRLYRWAAKYDAAYRAFLGAQGAS